MTEENKEVTEPEKFYSPEELYRMFDTEFLPMLQTISKRFKETLKEADETVGFRLLLMINFLDDEKKLCYEDIEDKIEMKLVPLVKTPQEDKEENNEELAEENA